MTTEGANLRSKGGGLTRPPDNYEVVMNTQEEFPTLRKAIKRMKGKRSCGVDLIDSYSLKLAAPLIEDALLHLINLSIE